MAVEADFSADKKAWRKAYVEPIPVIGGFEHNGSINSGELFRAWLTAVDTGQHRI